MEVRAAITWLFHCAPSAARGVGEHLKIWFFLYFDYSGLSPLLRDKLPTNTWMQHVHFWNFRNQNWHSRCGKRQGNMQNKYLLLIPFSLLPPLPPPNIHIRHTQVVWKSFQIQNIKEESKGSGVYPWEEIMHPTTMEKEKPQLRKVEYKGRQVEGSPTESACSLMRDKERTSCNHAWM